MKYHKSCKYCKKLYKGYGKYYCSRKCFLEDSNPLLHSRKSVRRICISCGKEFFSKSREKIVKFCSIECKVEYNNRDLIKNWLEGKNNGEDCGKHHCLKKPIRKYMLKQVNYTCQICKNNIWNGKPIPLQVHHKDGNAHNNKPENLLVLCWNCHAQTDTFGSKNKNSTRIYRWK
jgi:hypothetical protein